MTSIKNKARRDMARFTSNKNEWGETITLSNPDKSISIEVGGMHSKINISVNTDGNIVDSKSAHVSFSETYLREKSYPVRNTAKEVDLEGHFVDVVDESGEVKNYRVKRWFPDEELGHIVCILEDYATD